MTPLKAGLLFTLWVALAAGCSLEWDRVWSDAGALPDGQSLVDLPGVDLKPDKGTTPPDKGTTPPPDKAAITTATCKDKTKGFTCRKSRGDCDPAETCTGTSNKCPTDELSKQGKTCRKSTGSCDPKETCTGKSHKCPADVVWGKQQKKELFWTKQGSDGHAVKYFPKGDYSFHTQSVRMHCKPDNTGFNLARGFLSFDTRSLPVGTKITGAVLTGCLFGNKKFSGHVNIYSAKIVPTISMTTVYNAPVVDLNTQLPGTFGIQVFTVPHSSVKRGSFTQYQLRWSVTTCNDSTGYSGQVWSGAAATKTDKYCTKFPWKLTVVTCVP